MSISFYSIKNFTIINSLLVCMGIFQYNYSIYFTDINILYDFFAIYFIFILRNYILLNFIELSIKHKPQINIVNHIEDYKYEFHKNVIISTSIEAITHLFICTTMMNSSFYSREIYYDILYFIPFSFYFEILFDLFHYITHRLAHYKLIYKYLHKKHHKFLHPISIMTFYQDPIDLLFTNSLPTVLSLYIFPYLSYRQFHIILIYKTYTEICGHIGRFSYPTTSFPQFIWLPKLLNIELYTEDHDLHHSMNNCNYSKRFSLWDKVFNTYSKNNL